MVYTLTIRIRAADGTSPGETASAVATWVDTLNGRLSSRSEAFRFEDHDGELWASARPGDADDLNHVVDACVGLRAARPELQVALTDSLDNDLMPATPEAPDVAVELRWKGDMLEVLVGPIDDDRRPDVLVDFGGGRTTTVPPLWKAGDQWVYQVWLLGELEGANDATVRLVEE